MSICGRKNGGGRLVASTTLRLEGINVKKTFVFSAVGDHHIQLTNIALRFLKAFTRNDIIVVTSRTSLQPDHDQCISVSTPSCFSNHEASITLKTDLLRPLRGSGDLFCYLDNDILAVSEQINDVFDLKSGPITFAQDHSTVAAFSRYAVHCDCTGDNCPHLVAEISRLFGVRVTDPSWRHWNGGVFLFDEESSEFLKTWHEYALLAFEDPAWRTRDQGTLIATIWKLGLQNQGTLPRETNYLVDPHRGLSAKQRETVTARQCPVNEAYSLTGAPGLDHPIALHLINGGSHKVGWKNFDDTLRFLESVELWRSAQRLQQNSPLKPLIVPTLDALDTTISDASPAELPADAKPMYTFQSVPPKRRRSSASNRVVHGLWIGKKLGRLELLTLRSFINWGHEFRLWCYADLVTPLPDGVTLCDANEILPARAIYRRRAADPVTGVGEQSYGPFSDLFRYKLLYEHGGYWTDMDVTCLRPLDFAEPYVFRAHRVGVIGNFMKCPSGSQLMKETYEQTHKEVNAESPWLLTNQILSRGVERHGLTQYIHPEISNPDVWNIVQKLAEEEILLPSNLYVIHWLNEAWRARANTSLSAEPLSGSGSGPQRDNPPAGSTLARLYEAYGV